jgi:hypothetical protein
VVVVVVVYFVGDGDMVVYDLALTGAVPQLLTSGL